MGQKVLVTIDLSNASEEQRDKFYKVLKEEKWLKLKNLTTAWKVSFKNEVTRIDAINTIKNELKKAKTSSKVSRVDYAMQLNTIDLLNGDITI